MVYRSRAINPRPLKWGKQSLPEASGSSRVSSKKSMEVGSIGNCKPQLHSNCRLKGSGCIWRSPCLPGVSSQEVQDWGFFCGDLIRVANRAQARLPLIFFNFRFACNS